MLDMIGISHDTIRKGEHADMGSPFRQLSQQEKLMIDREIGEMYDSFISMVADARGKTVEDIDKIAGGRVWPGNTAAGHELVDALGGLSDAIEAAADEASVKKPVVRFYPEIKHGLVERMVMNMSREEKEDMSGVSVISAFAGMFSESRRLSGPLALMEEVVFKWN